MAEAPITDEELAEAIRTGGHQVRNGVKVLQLILDHVPPATRNVPWNGQQDFYCYIPQPMRRRFLERLDALVQRQLNPIPHPPKMPNTPVRTWPPTLVRRIATTDERAAGTRPSS
jgi:hypothetical protein